MTIEGAIAELQNLIKADDVPFYYNGAIQKVIETIIDECKPKVGRWIFDEKGYFFCSECKVKPNNQYATTDYCPNCGAKMERRADGDI